MASTPSAVPTMSVRGMTITLPFADQIRPLTAAEEQGLRASLHRENAVLDPIHVDKHGRLLDGHNRLRLAEELAQGSTQCDPERCPPHVGPLESIAVQIHADVDTDEAALGAICSLNVDRRHLTPAEQERKRSERKQRAAEMRARGATLEEIARTEGVSPEQVRQDISTFKDLKVDAALPLPERVVGKDGKARPTTYKKRTSVHASDTAQAGQALDTLQTAPVLPPGQHSAEGVRKIQQNGQRQARRQDRFDRLVAPDFNTITGPFPVIYADPPWQYDENTADPSRVIENHYPTMPLEEICALDVPQVCTQHAILFLWSPMPKLAEALRVMDAWGFEYRTGFVWVKGHSGMGHWVRMRHELLLLGKRGDMPTPMEANRQDSVISAVRGAHSAKPEMAYHIIEQMYPDVPRLELFARGAGRAGWTAWGNEVLPSEDRRVGG